MRHILAAALTVVRLAGQIARRRCVPSAVRAADGATTFLSAARCRTIRRRLPRRAEHACRRAKTAYTGTHPRDSVAIAAP